VFFTGSGSEATTPCCAWCATTGPARATGQAGDHQPPQRLSRLHRGGRQSGRHEGDARPGRPAHSGHRAHRPALSLR
jgi:hypothetical protein